jgi:signal transduction histidine kinase
MPDQMSILLSTLRSLPDGERIAVERELAPLARAAALGELAADVAHDVANPLFGILGLVDLLLEDTPGGSDDKELLGLLRQTALELKGTVGVLLDFVRVEDDDSEQASLADATRQALELLQHGVGRSLEIDARYAEEPAVVPCPRALLVQAVLQVLIASREAGRIEVEVGERWLRVSPPPEESLGALVALRIALDHGAAVERAEGSLTLTWLR